MILLDTHVVVWIAGAPERLTEQGRDAIAAETERVISTITVFEIAYLVGRRRLELDRPVRRWIADLLAVHELRALAPTSQVAVRAGSLDPNRFPGDPADRLIYATAVEHGAQLVTADERIRAADPDRVVW